MVSREIRGFHQEIFFKLFRGKIDKILVNSLGLREELVKRKLAKEKEVEIFYTGIDPEEFNLSCSKSEAREKFSLNPEEFYFGMTAQFRKEKDQKGLIKALKLLLSRGFKAKLVLAGDGLTLNEAKALVKELGLEEKVIFLGWVSPLEVPLFLKALDVFVFASLREGMPTAVLEAMAIGLPIIATAVEGIPDIFQINPNIGKMVPIGDIEALSQAMEEMMKLSEEERILLGKRAQQIIYEKFSDRVLKENTKELLKALLEK